jgi:serine/threonine protein kinase
MLLFSSKRTTFCGTLDYVSPEIVLGDEYGEMVDVWSVGVLCYELCTGHAPFESSKSREETYRKIVNVELKFPKYLSDDVKDFITRLLIKNPENRMSLTEAMGHRWVKRYFMK